MTRGLVRMQDIADRLGVSVVTVSKALSGKDGVGVVLRKQILDLAVELQYTGAHHRPSACTIGILVAEHLMQPEHSFYWALYLRVIDELKERGHHSMLELLRVQEQPAQLPVFLAEQKVEGVIVLGAMPQVHMRVLEQTNSPLVQVDCHSDGIQAHSVIANSFLGCAEVTRYSINKGHKSIGFVGDYKGHVHSRDCYYGYLKELEAHGLECRPEWRISDRDGTDFKRFYELPEELPTAFVCTSDQGAYHFVRDLQSKGIRVPEDVSVSGFYGHVFSTMVSPQLTTYKIDLHTMAARAVDALLAMLQGGLRCTELSVVCGKLIERQSVRVVD